MAIKLSELYPDNTAPPTPDYPYGEAVDVLTPGDGSGTPWKAPIINDVLGWQQALLSEAGIVPSGMSEKATESQYLQAKKRIHVFSSVITFDSVPSLKSGSLIGGASAKFSELASANAVVTTTSYRAGWSASTLGPMGGASYYITTRDAERTRRGDVTWIPDGLGDHYLDSGVEFVAVLIPDAGGVNIDQFGAIADFNYDTITGTDNKESIQAAIDWVGGIQDITTAFIYEPVTVVNVPPGKYGVSLSGAERILIDKNNIRIEGAGMFSSAFIQFGAAAPAEMVRFKTAYACALSRITLDGGLPFTPTGSEVIGADVPLTLDQVAHFESYSLNIVNYRLRGMQCVHLWESYFEDTRITNGGFFGTGAVPSACIAFDERGKEDNTFPGFESNQIRFNKVAFGGVGSYVKMTAPCFQITFASVIAETRTWPVQYTPSGESKWIIGGASASIIIDHAWTYAHDQNYVADVVLFDIINAGPNCKFLNYNIFQEILTGTGTNLEITKIFSNGGSYPIEVSLSVEDRGDAATLLFGSASVGSMITGRVDYRSDASRTKSDFLTTLGEIYFSGDLTFIEDGFTVNDPEVYEHVGRAQRTSAIDGGGVFNEFACRAIANFNGIDVGSGGGSRMQKGISIVRDGVGQYTATFDVGFPDANYVVNISIVRANLGDTPEIGSQVQTGFTFAVRDSAGTYHDSTTINVSVFR